MAGRGFARLTTKRLERREGDALGRNRRRHLFQAFLPHSLGKDGIGFAKRIDPVDRVNVEFAHIHRKLTHAVNQGCVRA